MTVKFIRKKSAKIVATKKTTKSAVSVPARQKSASASLVKNVALFGMSKRVRSNYYDYQVSFGAPAANSIGEYTYRCNGLFKPDGPNVGHQPIGFDQYMLMYNHYVVTSARISVTFRNKEANPIKVGIMVAPDNTAVTSTGILAINENGTLVTKDLNGTGMDGSIGTLNLNWDGAKYFGKKSLINDDVYRGNVNSNPTELAWFTLICWNPLSGTANGEISSVTCEVKIVYNVYLFEPRKLTTS